MTITIKTAEDIAGMRVACRLASEVLDYLTPFVKPGITTNEIDRLAHDYMTQVQGTIPAPLNYCPPGYIPDDKGGCVVDHGPGTDPPTGTPGGSPAGSPIRRPSGPSLPSRPSFPT